MTSAVLLPRVSGESQEDGHSLDAQTERLLAYARRHGFRVDRIFRIVESSTRGERAQFLAAITYAKSLRGPVAVVADSVDRVQRSFKESELLDDLRKSGRMEFHFLRENVIVKRDMDPSQQMLWDFAVLNAKGYVASLSHHVKRSIAYKIEHGEWPSKAPIGYRNIIDPITRKTTIVVDPSRAVFVRLLFEQFATGIYSIPQLGEKLRHDGFTGSVSPHPPVSTSTIRTVLANPFYVGEMKIKGMQLPHRYPPLVSRELFRQCLSLAKHRTTNRTSSSRIPFLFRGLISCKQCGHTITSEKKKDRWTYLACHSSTCRGGGVREEVATDLVIEQLSQIHVPPDTLQRVQPSFESAIKERLKARQTIRHVQQRRIALLRRQIEGCLDLALCYPTQAMEWGRRVRALRTEEVHLLTALRKPRSTREFQNARTLLADAENLFGRATSEERRQIIATAFLRREFSPRSAWRPSCISFELHNIFRPRRSEGE